MECLFYRTGQGLVTRPSVTLAIGDIHGRRLGLYGLLTHWQELEDQPWVQTLIAYEEAERSRRSLERRIRTSKVGRFKTLVDFDC